MSLNQPIIDSVTQNLSMFGFAPSFVNATEESGTEISLGDVHILFGLTDGMHGSIVLGFKMPTALQIVSFMMGGMPIESMDEMSQSAIGELGNMIVGTAITNARSSILINFSPPTLIIDGHLYIPTKEPKHTKLEFELNGIPFYVAYSTEAK
jgi:chemotaxis protein CheX